MFILQYFLRIISQDYGAPRSGFFIFLSLLNFRCTVPPISLLTPVLDFGKCFLHYPYELMMELMNDSDLPAKYELIAQVEL